MNLQEQLEQDWPGVFEKSVKRSRGTYSLTFDGHQVFVYTHFVHRAKCNLSNGGVFIFEFGIMPDLVSYVPGDRTKVNSNVKTTYFDRFPESGIDSDF